MSEQIRCPFSGKFQGWFLMWFGKYIETYRSCVCDWHQRLWRAEIQCKAIPELATHQWRIRLRVAWVRHLLHENCNVPLRMISEKMKMNRDACHQSICNNSGKWKLNATIVSPHWQMKQKEIRQTFAAELLERARSDTTFALKHHCQRWSWCYQYDPQIKWQSAK